MSGARLRLVGAPVLDPHDGELLARVAAGELTALATLYDRHAATLLRFARRIGAGQEAEDVVQVVFVRVVRLAKAFDPAASSARSWLFVIALRVVQERRRALRRWTSAMAALAVQKRAESRLEPPHGADLERCLSRISMAKRSVVVLADIEGFSCDEIASMLGVPVGTVWTRLHHARKELRALWEGTP